MSVLLMPLLIWLAPILGIVDHPTHRKIHSKPTPYLGGIGILAGFSLVPAAYYLIYKSPAPSADLLRLALIAGPAIAASILGLIDDARHVRALIKFAVQFVVVTAFVYFGFRINFIKIPGLGLPYDLYSAESIPVTVLWMLVTINGVNLIDGIDGLAGTVMAVIFAAIAILALNLPQPDYLVAIVALAALGGTLGFLVFNWSPAKIYMGDTGSLAAGTLIATLLVAMGQTKLAGADGAGDSEPFSFHIAKITLVAFYPIMEISLSVLRRYLSGKPIGSADKGHIHHRLLRWGWTARMVCIAAGLMGAIAASAVIAAEFHYLSRSGWLLMLLGVCFALVLHFCGYLEMLHPKFIRGNRPHFRIANHIVSAQREKLELVHNLGEISALAAQTCIEFGVKSYALKLVPGGIQTAPLDLSWSKPEDAHGTFIPPPEVPSGSTILTSFADKTDLRSGSHAEWIFEPHDAEDEIDVEYHVLMSEFMRKVLEMAEQHYWNGSAPPPTLREQPTGTPGVSSSVLRRRKGGSSRFDKATVGRN